ncbi:hypothetical protein [Pedobacter steynii]
MINVTILPITDLKTKPGTPLARIMNERLARFATELQTYFQKQFVDEKHCEDLVVYLGYNSTYSVRWKIVNDVPEYIQDRVAKRCGNLGFIQWKEFDLYSYRPNLQY